MSVKPVICRHCGEHPVVNEHSGLFWVSCHTKGCVHLKQPDRESGYFRIRELTVRDWNRNHKIEGVRS